MASITFSFPDEAVPLIAQAFCDSYGYRSTIPDPDSPGKTIPNPQTPAEFTRQKVVDYVREVCRGYIAKTAIAQAKATAQQVAQKQVDDIPVTVTAG